MPRPTFFVTAVCHERASIFRNQSYADLFTRMLYHYRSEGKYAIHEFVVMHDHVHLIITPAENLSLERVMQFLKGGYSHRAGKELSSKREIWQRSFTHESIRSADAYAGFRNYIWMNPVRKGYCVNPEEFPYSSASGKFELDAVPELIRG